MVMITCRNYCVFRAWRSADECPVFSAVISDDQGALS